MEGSDESTDGKEKTCIEKIHRFPAYSDESGITSNPKKKSQWSMSVYFCSWQSHALRELSSCKDRYSYMYTWLTRSILSQSTRYSDHVYFLSNYFTQPAKHCKHDQKVNSILKQCFSHNCWNIINIIVNAFNIEIKQAQSHGVFGLVTYMWPYSIFIPNRS